MPVNKVVRVQVTGADVIHSFAVPVVRHQDRRRSGPAQRDLVQGDREGVYYGQCSELCGKDHAFMPIAVRVVSEDEYDAWLADAKKKFAAGDERDRASRPPPTARRAINAAG